MQVSRDSNDSSDNEQRWKKGLTREQLAILLEANDRSSSLDLEEEKRNRVACCSILFEVHRLRSNCLESLDTHRGSLFGDRSGGGGEAKHDKGWGNLGRFDDRLLDSTVLAETGR